MSDDNILLTGHAKVLLAICVVALIVPLSMLRNMSLLAIPSLLSLMCILYTGVVVVSNGASFWGDGHDCGPKLFDATTGVRQSCWSGVPLCPSLELLFRSTVPLVRFCLWRR